jgi:hypothetical protein
MNKESFSDKVWTVTIAIILLAYVGVSMYERAVHPERTNQISCNAEDK